MKKITGIFPALVTPYNTEGKVDVNKIQALVEKLQNTGVNGFYVGGSTGESYLLRKEERKKILEAVKEAADPKLDIIANIGMLDTEQSIELAEHAQKIGVTAISSVPPFYFPYSTEEYYSYYEELTMAVDIPVLIYNIPAMSGVNFSMENLNHFLSNEKIMGLKHTSYDLFQLQRLIQLYPEKTWFLGHDELFLSALSIGVRAAIGSTFNVMAEKFIQMYQLFEEKRMEDALKIQGDVNAVIEVLGKVGVFKGIKEILKLQGLDCGDCRKPFQPLNSMEKKMVAEAAEKYGLI